MMMGFIVSTSKKKRMCHLCGDDILQKALHLRIHFTAQFKHRSYLNFCNRCINLDHVMALRSVTPGEFLPPVILGYKDGGEKKGTLDAALGLGDIGDPLPGNRKRVKFFSHLRREEDDEGE